MAAISLSFCYLAEALLKTGEVRMARSSAGLDYDVVELITKEEAFDAAIHKLLLHSLVQEGVDDRGSRSFSIHPLVQYCVVQRT